MEGYLKRNASKKLDDYRRMSVYFSRSFSFISGLSFIFELQVVLVYRKRTETIRE